jgi:hypothetical protein
MYLKQLPSLSNKLPHQAQFCMQFWQQHVVWVTQTFMFDVFLTWYQIESGEASASSSNTGFVLLSIDMN